VITEVVYLLAIRLGVPAELRFLGDLASGAFDVTRARHHLDPAGITWIDNYEKAIADAAEDGTVAGRSMIDLNLTLQLRYPNSPMSQFMALYLPNSAALVQDYLEQIAGLALPVQPIDVKYPDWSALGHAIDLRLRLSLGSPLGAPVSIGVDAIGGRMPLRGAPPPSIRGALHRVGQALLSTVDAYLGRAIGLDEDVLCRLCFVAAYYEDIYRTGEIRRYSMLADATPATTLDDFMAAVPGYATEDIGRQMDLAAKPFAPFRRLPVEARICGPTFQGSQDIGGADADFILGGLLLDCKAAIQPRRLGRNEDLPTRRLLATGLRRPVQNRSRRPVPIPARRTRRLERAGFPALSRCHQPCK